MTALEVLRQCQGEGIILSTANGKIQANAPKGALNVQLRQAIKSVREQLIELLESGQACLDDQVHQGPQPCPAGTKSPLSPYQDFLWASQADENPDISMLHMFAAFDLQKHISAEAMQLAWDTLLERHHALRTSFTVDSTGVASQFVTQRELMPMILATAPNAEEHSEVLASISHNFQYEPYDLASDLPIRVGFIESPQRQTLALGLHHLVADGWSAGVLLRELFMLLEQKDVQDATLPPLPFQHQDYSIWLKDTFLPKSAEKQKHFWREKISRMPPLHALQTDYARPLQRTGQTAQIPLHFKSEDIKALEQAGQTAGISLFILLYTCFRIALYRFGGDPAPVITVPTANRQTLAGLENVVGCIANKILLHCPLNPGETIANTIATSRNCLLEAMANQEFPFSSLLQLSSRVQSWQPLSQIFFSYNKLDISDLPITHIPLKQASVNNDLAIVVWDDAATLSGVLEYDPAIFSADSMRQLAGIFYSTCKAIVLSKEHTPLDLPLSEPGKAARQTEQLADVSQLLALKKGDTLYWHTPEESAEDPALKQLIARVAQEREVDCLEAETLPMCLTSLLGANQPGANRPETNPSGLKNPAQPPSPENSIIITSCHPRLLAEQFAAKLLPQGVRICFVNNLFHAPTLKCMQESGALCSLLLQSPLTQETAENPKYLTVDLKQLPLLSGNERFIAFASSLPLPTAAPGELFAAAPDFYVKKSTAGQLLLPLPGPEHRLAWHKGLYLDLDRLAHEISACLDGMEVALGMTPEPAAGQTPTEVCTERLVAWAVPWTVLGTVPGTVPGAGTSETSSAISQSIPPTLPAHLPVPEHWVKLSSLPLVSQAEEPGVESGKTDFQRLARLPILSECALKTLNEATASKSNTEKTLSQSQESDQNQIFFTLCDAAPVLPVLHHNDLLMATRSLPAQRYTPLNAGTAFSGKTAQSELVNTPRSEVYGGDLQLNPERFSFIDALEQAVENNFVFMFPDGADWVEKRTSGESLLLRSRQLLHGLQQNNVRQGDKVIAHCSRQDDILALCWACLQGSMCLSVFLPPAEGQSSDIVMERFNSILHTLDHPLVVADEATTHLPEIKNIRSMAQISQGDATQAILTAKLAGPIHMAFTSGSTGKPKAVPLSATNIASMLLAKSQWLGAAPHEVFLSITSLDHVASLFSHSFLAVTRKADQTLCPVQYVLGDPARICDMITKFKITTTWAPEFMWRQLHAAAQKRNASLQNWDLSSLTHIFSGGEPTREKTLADLDKTMRNFGCENSVLSNAWGMAETSSFFSISAPWQEGKLQTNAGIVDAGAPFPGMAMRVVNPQGEVVPQGDTGFFQVSGPSVISGYYNNPQANSEDFTPDGWFDTGDLAKIQNGQVIFQGRKKEILIIRGQNLSQTEIEGAVESIAGVTPGYTAVIGCLDTRSQNEEIIVFFCSDRQTIEGKTKTITEIQTKLSSNFGIVPRYIIPVAKGDIPKTGLGKIQRTALLGRFLDDEFANAIRDVDLLMRNAETIPDWHLQKQWVHQALTGSGNAPDMAKWGLLLVSPCQDSASRLAAKFTAMGALVEVCLSGASQNEASSDEANWQKQLAHIFRKPETGLVFVVPPAPEISASGLDDFNRWQQAAIIPITQAMRLLSEKSAHAPRLLCAVCLHTPNNTGGRAHDNTGQNPDQSFALAMSASLLASQRRQKSTPRTLAIDVAAELNADSLECIAREITTAHGQPVVAIRKSKRLIRSLAPVRFASASRHLEFPATAKAARGPGRAGLEQAFAKDSFCICTGGLGTVGMSLLPQVLAYTEGNLLVLGRRALSEATSELSELAGEAHANRVFYVQADLSDQAALKQAVGQARAFFNTPPGAILHLAGDTTASHIQTLSSEAFLQGTSQALRYLLELEKIAGEYEITGPFIVFSTVFSHWGERGFSLYGASSAVKEAFVLSRAHNNRPNNTQRDNNRRDRGKACTNQSPAQYSCLSWSLWTRQLQREEDQMQQRFLKQRGFLPVSARNGFTSLLGLLGTGVPHAMIGVDRFAPAIACEVRSGARLCQYLETPDLNNNCRIYPLVNSRCPALPSGFTREARAAAGAPSPGSYSRSGLEERMIGVWQAVLGLDNLDVEANFFELGGSSILLPKLRVRVLETFGVDIGSTGIFQHASAREMAHAVGEREAHFTSESPGSLKPQDSSSLRGIPETSTKTPPEALGIWDKAKNRADAQRAARKRAATRGKERHPTHIDQGV